MTLNEAKEFAKNEIEKANVVVVTSDKAVYLLRDIAEIEVIKSHADRNKLQMFVLKPSDEVVEIATEEKPEVVETEVKPKKKK